jgi:hypothetical protein
MLGSVKVSYDGEVGVFIPSITEIINGNPRTPPVRGARVIQNHFHFPLVIKLKAGDPYCVASRSLVEWAAISAVLGVPNLVRI